MKLSQKPSKIWIYGPLYILLIFIICAGTWRVLRPEEANIQTEEVLAVKAGVVPACFKENCELRSPIFQLWPDEEIIKAIKSQDGICADVICGLCEESERFSKDEPFTEDDCLSSLFKTARKYHFTQLANLPKKVLFFDSGESQLSEDQSYDLKAFLSSYKGLKDKKGVLIIGRASKGGSEVDNKNLSHQRSSNIQIMLGTLLGQDFKRDYVYFGDKPPQLTVDDANALDVESRSYRDVKVTGATKLDYSIRLNQSVIVVVYDLGDGVFGEML